MKHNHYILLFTLFFLIGACSKRDKLDISEPEKPLEPAYKLVWSDEFDYSGLPDATKWSYDVGGHGWGNGESQFYTNARLKNAEVKNGLLHITAIKEDFEGKNYTSARLVTKAKGDWLYGQIVVRAKLPDGYGMWPAIWMLPTDRNYGGGFESGEIDIMENLGYLPHFIVATVQTKLFNHMQGTHKQSAIAITDCYTEFHDYILEWEPSELRFYVDKQLYFAYKNDLAGFHSWPFDKRFHLILNVAVGGTYGGALGIDDRIFPRTMIVDYVRVFQK